VILANETRWGAKALDVLVFAGREAAKMRPSEDRCCKNGWYARTPMSPDRIAKMDNPGKGQVGRQRKLAV